MAKNKVALFMGPGGFCKAWGRMKSELVAYCRSDSFVGTAAQPSFWLVILKLV